MRAWQYFEKKNIARGVTRRSAVTVDCDVVQYGIGSHERISNHPMTTVPAHLTMIEVLDHGELPESWVGLERARAKIHVNEVSLWPGQVVHSNISSKSRLDRSLGQKKQHSPT